MSAQAPALQHKTIHLSSFKALDDEQGVFEGYLAVFGNVDSYGDVIERGAFKNTLAKAEKTRSQRGEKYLFPILWQHSPHEPIGGFLEMREDDFGLYVKGQLDLDIELGRRAYSGMKKGYIRGLSIGYDVVKQAWDGQIRRLKEINLWEGSVVTFPANPLANVSAVKADEKGGEAGVNRKARDFKTIFSQAKAQEDLAREWLNIQEALHESIREIIADPAIEEKAVAVGESIDQFKEAVVDWVTRAAATDLVQNESKMAFMVPLQKQLSELTAALQKAAFVMQSFSDQLHESKAAEDDGVSETPSNDPASELKQLQNLLADMREFTTKKGVA